MVSTFTETTASQSVSASNWQSALAGATLLAWDAHRDATATRHISLYQTLDGRYLVTERTRTSHFQSQVANELDMRDLSIEAAQALYEQLRVPPISEEHAFTRSRHRPPADRSAGRPRRPGPVRRQPAPGVVVEPLDRVWPVTPSRAPCVFHLTEADR